VKTRSSFRIAVCAIALTIPAFLLAMGSTKLTVVSPSPLPAASVGVADNHIMLSAGGTRPFTWTVKSGTLPAGIKLQAEKLVGKATTAGTSTFTVQVADSKTHTAFKTFSLTVKR
jgi:hypothetical protein